MRIVEFPARSRLLLSAKDSQGDSLFLIKRVLCIHVLSSDLQLMYEIENNKEWVGVEYRDFSNAD